MKLKTLILAGAVSLSLFSLNAFSIESEVCLNPIKAICNDTKVQRAIREKHIRDIQNEIDLKATKNAAPRIAKMKKDLKKKSFIRIGIEAVKIKNQEVKKASIAKVAGIENDITDLTNILMIKNYMRQAIDESGFNQATRMKFKKIIDSVQIGNFSDFLEKYDSDDSLLAQIANPCDSSGMVANAFATTLKNQEKYVLICPGFLITLSQTPNKRDQLNTILHTIAHELGHHLYISLDEDDLYRPYLSCLSRNYSQSLTRSQRDQTFCNKNPSECGMKVTESHAKEMIADQWGIKVLAIHARTEGYSISQADSLLVNSWANICDGRGTAVHPSTAFRVNVLLRLNPEISDYLSCNNSKIKKAACSFEGEDRL